MMFWVVPPVVGISIHLSRFEHSSRRFFLKWGPAKTVAENYLQQVKTMHEVGRNGSTGLAICGYDWKRAKAEKNLLRTHTTAVSSRMLYKLAQEGLVAKKCFPIDQVFRNEAVDKTHLAEFHQVEDIMSFPSLHFIKCGQVAPRLVIPVTS